MSILHITTQPRRVDSRWIGLMWRSGLQYIRSSPGPDTRIPLSSKGTEFKQPGKRLNAVRFEIRTPHERKKRARVRISIGRDIIPTFWWGRWWGRRRPDERLAEPRFPVAQGCRPCPDHRMPPLFSLSRSAFRLQARWANELVPNGRKWPMDHTRRRRRWQWLIKRRLFNIFRMPRNPRQANTCF
jgi:hypothetical protein